MAGVRIGQGWELSRRQINSVWPEVLDALPTVPSEGIDQGKRVTLRVAFMGNDPYTDYVYDADDEAWHAIKGAV